MSACMIKSELVTEIYRLLVIAKTRTTHYHLLSDGLVERLNQTFLNTLGTAAQDWPFDWEDYLHHLCMAYNTSVQPTTGYTPFYLMFGHQALMPLDVIHRPPPSQPSTACKYALKLWKNLEAMYQNVCDHMNHQLDWQKAIYGRRVHGKPFDPGELHVVWLYSPATPQGQCIKFH